LGRGGGKNKRTARPTSSLCKGSGGDIKKVIEGKKAISRKKGQKKEKGGALIIIEIIPSRETEKLKPKKKGETIPVDPQKKSGKTSLNKLEHLPTNLPEGGGKGGGKKNSNPTKG